MKKNFLFIVFLLVVLVGSAQSELDKSLSSLTTEIQEKLKSVGKTKVAVMDITDVNRNTTTMGKYIANVVSVYLVNNPGYFQIVDRENMDQLLKEQKLNYQGYIDVSTAKQLGKLLAVDAIVVGTYTVFNDKVTIALKVINSENALVIAAAMKTVIIDSDVQSLLGKEYSKPFKASSTTLITPQTQNNNEPTITFAQAPSNMVPANQATTSLLDQECATKKYGDFCFYNANSTSINLSYKQPRNFNSSPNSLTISPKQTQCIYHLTTGPWEYLGRIAGSDERTGYGDYVDIQGQFLVEQCKSKTITLTK